MTIANEKGVFEIECFVVLLQPLTDLECLASAGATSEVILGSHVHAEVLSIRFVADEFLQAFEAVAEIVGRQNNEAFFVGIEVFGGGEIGKLFMTRFLSGKEK
jgi:hypothetical protein